MAGSINKVTLLGYIGKEPEIRTSNVGKKIANFSLATTNSWKDRTTGEKKSKTEWHRVVVFNDSLVGVIERYVKKGSQLYIEGELATRKWTDTSGSEKYTTEVVLNQYNSNLVLLGANSGSGEGSGNIDLDSEAPGMVELDDEIPF